jgi:hypothetical protein
MAAKTLLVRKKLKNCISFSGHYYRYSCVHIMETERRAGVRVTREIYLNIRSHGQNLSSTSSQTESIAQYFFKNWITGLGLYSKRRTDSDLGKI